MKKIKTQIYSLEIPDNWFFNSDDSGIVSVFDPEGKGALTISSYSSSSDFPDAVTMLKKFVNGRGPVIKKEGKLDVAASEYEDSKDGKTIFVYSISLCKDNQLILVSYNCEKGVLTESELKKVYKIVETLKFETK